MNTIYEALSDPIRRQILDLLRERPHHVGELVTLLGKSQPNVSKHLRVLREAGLVQVRQAAQQRWYALDPTPLAELDTWLESFRVLWAERYDRLKDYLATLPPEDSDLTE
ncbi:MAG: metalloregulator ArsR/SmtB family transcription factor [Anaerolineae bacterium]|jgi:DNA-binding transcriptional ArsR family regulator|nr:metalloregulator ArsR/SmtB family transcription factor [Anaerolineae bacterium]